MATLVSYLFLLLLISQWPVSFAKSLIHDPSSASLPSRAGFDLIKQLNLHPKLDVNIFKPNTSDSDSILDSRVVEKTLRLPVLGNANASIQDLAHLVGYVRIKHTIGGRMFYYFYESRNSKDDPVVVWLTGGPGCSSALSLLVENGPFLLTNNLSLVWNDFGWDKVANMLYIDQPIGTGFSYSSSYEDIPHDEKGVSDDLYDFLQGFFEVHPDYLKNDLYIAGSSYGGHYVPAFAERINQGNKNKEGIHLNLKGIAIGNGLTEPATQFKANPDYALVNSLIDRQDYNRIIIQMMPECVKAAEKCGTKGVGCLKAWHICQSINDEISSLSDKCIYDVRRHKHDCGPKLRIDDFLNMPEVKKELGVPQDIPFEMCSDLVYFVMAEDIMRNLEVGIPALLEENINVLIYVGEYDLICNWLGNLRWIKAMKWSGQPNFEASVDHSFLVDGNEAGVLKTYGPLAFLKVHDAGHMAPMNQPKASLHMLKMWIDGKLTLPENIRFQSSI